MSLTTPAAAIAPKSLCETVRFSASAVAAVPAAADAAASVANSNAPTGAVLEELARSTPGTSMFEAFKYGSELHPYPVWWLDPEGPLYSFMIKVASNSSQVLQHFHDAAGLPWWATIVMAGAFVRASTLPLNIYSLRNAARSQDAQADVGMLRQAYARASVALGPKAPVGDRVSLMLATLRGVQAALHRAKCYPWRSFVIPFVQVPIAIAGVLGARHSVLLGDRSFEAEGAMWFQDLTVPDPIYVLPMVSLSLAYLSLDVMFKRPAAAAAVSSAAAKSVDDADGQPAQQRVVGSSAFVSGGVSNLFKNTMQISIIASSPFLMELPAGLYLLMAANSAWTMAYLTAVRHPTVYSMLTGRAAPSSPSPVAAVTPSSSSSSNGNEESDGHAPRSASNAAGASPAAMSAASGNAPQMRYASEDPDLQRMRAAASFYARLEANGGGIAFFSKMRPQPSSLLGGGTATASPSGGIAPLGASMASASGGAMPVSTAAMLAASGSMGLAGSREHARSVTTVAAAAPIVLSSSPSLDPPPISSADGMLHPSAAQPHHHFDHRKVTADQPATPGSKPKAENEVIAAALQQSARLIYMDSVVSDSEERELVGMLSRTFNTSYPVLHGHPNPLMLRIAGGAMKVGATRGNNAVLRMNVVA